MLSFTYFIIYTLLIVLIIYDIYLCVKLTEFAYCAFVRHQPPLYASANMLRERVIEQIITKYNKSKNICEIGSGFGGLARAIAFSTNAKVYALENMPFSALVSKIADYKSKCKNNKTIWCDAFKYLKNTDIKFDVAVAYLGPTFTSKLYNYRNKFNVLISIDFEIQGTKPTKIIDIGYGYTTYMGTRYPHKLFIYEFK